MTSDHFDGRRFFNPDGPPLQPLTAVARMMREPQTRWPSHIATPLCEPPPLQDAAATITFIGHSTLLIQTPDGNIITDPVYAQRAGPYGLVGPRRARPAAVPFDTLPPIALIALSHNHYDHCDLATLRRLARRFDPVVVTPIGNGRLVKSAGVRRVEELDWWEHTDIANVSVTVTPAHHFWARTPFDRNRSLWGGFVLATSDVRIYFAGDTAYAKFFPAISQRLGPIDVALLPIGAYEPRWFMQSVHMNPAEAVQAHIDLAATRSIGTHFGTFQLTTEGIDEPLRALAEARHHRGIPASAFFTLEFGASLHLARAGR